MSTTLGRRLYHHILGIPPSDIRVRHFEGDGLKGQVHCWVNIELPSFIKDLDNTFTLASPSSTRQLFGEHYIELIVQHLFRTHFTFFLRYLNLVSQERYDEYDLVFRPGMNIGEQSIVLSFFPEDVILMLEAAYSVITNGGCFYNGSRNDDNSLWTMQYRAAVMFAACLRIACKSGEAVVTPGILQEAILEGLRYPDISYGFKGEVPNIHVRDLENYLIDPTVQSTLRSIRGFKYWNNDAALVKLWELAPDLRKKVGDAGIDISRTEICGNAILERVEWIDEHRWRSTLGDWSCGCDGPNTA